jgi:hypothetical protein
LAGIGTPHGFIELLGIVLDKPPSMRRVPDPSWSLKGEDMSPGAVSLSSNHAPHKLKHSFLVGRGKIEDIPRTWLLDTEMVI